MFFWCLRLTFKQHAICFAYGLLWITMSLGMLGDVIKKELQEDVRRILSINWPRYIFWPLKKVFQAIFWLWHTFWLVRYFALHLFRFFFSWRIWGRKVFFCWGVSQTGWLSECRIGLVAQNRELVEMGNNRIQFLSCIQISWCCEIFGKSKMFYPTILGLMKATTQSWSLGTENPELEILSQQIVSRNFSRNDRDELRASKKLGVDFALGFLWWFW